MDLCIVLFPVLSIERVVRLRVRTGDPGRVSEYPQVPA